MRDAFAFTVALLVEDSTETGWSRDLSKRADIYRMFDIEVASLAPQDEPHDPMLTPPPAHLAEQQLEEFRAAMAGKPLSPAND